MKCYTQTSTLSGQTAHRVLHVMAESNFLPVVPVIGFHKKNDRVGLYSWLEHFLWKLAGKIFSTGTGKNCIKFIERWRWKSATGGTCCSFHAGDSKYTLNTRSPLGMKIISKVSSSTIILLRSLLSHNHIIMMISIIMILHCNVLQRCRWASEWVLLSLGSVGGSNLHRMRGVRSEMGRQMPDIYEADLPGRAS